MSKFTPPRSVPIPDVDSSVPNPRVRFPDAPMGRPTRPVPGGKGKPPPEDFWTFAYHGPSGVEGAVVEFPPIELPSPKPIVLLFFQDPTVRDPVTSTPQSPLEESAVFNRADIAGGNPGAEGLGIDQPSSPDLTTQIRASVDQIGGPDLSVATFDDVSSVLIEWGTSVVRFALSSVALVAGSPDYLELAVSVESSTLNEPFDFAGLVSLVLETPQPDLVRRPNAGVRARIRYTIGKAEDVPIECDWSGAVRLMASRVELSRVSIVVDPTEAYEPQPIKVGAVALVNGEPPALPPTLTEPTGAVAIGATRYLEVPAFARRVSLLALYGNEGAPGDIPLGQIFVGFEASSGRALGYIDAMSAREALFGVEGVAIPYGTARVGVSNRSLDASMRLGVVWYLGA